jgi:hypothetical protein
MRQDHGVVLNLCPTGMVPEFAAAESLLVTYPSRTGDNKRGQLSGANLIIADLSALTRVDPIQKSTSIDSRVDRRTIPGDAV